LRYIFVVFAVIFISGCSFKNGVAVEQVHDLQEIPQDVSVYTKGLDVGYISSLESYKESYFKPWHQVRIAAPLDEAMWAYKVFTPQKSYGENLQHIEQQFFDSMLENSNFAAYATLNKPALSLKNLNLRAFPTNRPLFRDPNAAGEGFPFDYLQNSTVGANKPLLISHYSKDRAWVFVESSFAHGWVKSRDIVFMPREYIKAWESVQQVFFLQDNVAVADAKGEFLFYSRIGMMLPFIDENASTITLLSVSKYADGEPFFHASTFAHDVAHSGILAFNETNVNAVIEQLQKMHYGWGGMYGQRDCSSTMRDFFAPFGIWLPRNSSKQAQVGKIISLEGMSDKEKLATIKKEGVAFRTLLYKKGHIVLYVGVYNGKVVVFQNMWGIKTLKYGKAGRFVIGRAVFSTLEIGKELYYYDKNASLLSHISSMNILTP